MLPTNFTYLQEHDEQLVRLGMLAERYFPDDPNTTLLKLRQLTELLAQLIATRVGLYVSTEEAQYELVRRLQDDGIVPRDVAQLFDDVRRSGNAASHRLAGDHRAALAALKFTWQLGLWFHRTFAAPNYQSGPFIPPARPKDESEELRAELERLAGELALYRATHEETAEQLAAVESRLREARDEQVFWEQLAVETEQEKVALAQRLAAQQAVGAARPVAARTALVSRGAAAARVLQLDEAETRRLIDEQLRQAGWTVDSATLTHRAGARPEKGKNLAIAEWPTASGPADYVLFIGLMPVAAVEAKRKNTDVSAYLQQAKRYSRDFRPSPEMTAPGAPWAGHALPFVFSTNGQPYLRQLATHSGIWFADVRRPDNLAHPLDGWYTPEGLMALLKRDDEQAHQRLKSEPFDYGFPLRHYQQAAIEAVEAAIGQGRRELLVAMATGTGKTKMAIALIYRLLKVQRVRRVLFLVDRETLGEQAGNAFTDTRMENQQTFADIFGVKELGERTPETETAVQVATVQSMVQRVLNPGEGAAPPPVDQFDCIIVDECHRGYLLDRELSDTELEFRGFDDYISKYRRVLEYFDAIKIGLTATPALHTTEIFGPPVYLYTYREAVIDGYLVDHEPPIQIETELTRGGIRWGVGESVQVYDAGRNAIELITAPDTIALEVEDFNRKVITEPFNRVVCEVLAGEIDPASLQKTLIFCVNDAHADLVVSLLKTAFAERYGAVDDDAVMKITAAADKPLQLFRRFKNERQPNVAVTVDLLTTGIDVHEICNLVFLRRVNSRILYEQMIGRATRLCDRIGKESFRIFDAVRMYEAIKDQTTMTAVVVNPKVTFAQLIEELGRVATDEGRQVIADQLVAKLQRVKRRLDESTAGHLEARAGMPAEQLAATLRQMAAAELAEWFADKPEIGELLDRRQGAGGAPVYISEHPDQLIGVERGYGGGKKPADYLEEFAAFVRNRGNEIPALITVLTRPRELTRRQLRELALELDKAGFTEAALGTAWREMTNQDIAARIVGFIRQAALGEPLMPYEQRVERALQTVFASKYWSGPQREWLRKIAAQTVANIVVDRAALNDPDLIFKREGGGFGRLNRLFNGELEQVLERFSEALWPPAA